MRGLKILGIILGSFVVLIALLLSAVALFVDPNDYRQRVAQKVKAATGRDLILAGNIKLSVFPWIALELGPASLGNSPGFGAEPFLSVQRAALRVKLLPLLHRKLQVGRIEIDGLDLRLQTNAAGKGNWEDFGRGAQAGQSADSTAADRSDSSVSLQGLGGILLKNGRVSYDAVTVSSLSVDVGNVSERVAIPVKLSFVLNSGMPGGRDSNFAMTVDVTLDPEARTLTAPAFAAQLDETHVHGSLAVTNLDTRATSFDVSVDQINLDRYLAPANAAAPGPPQAARPKLAEAPTALPSSSLKALNIDGSLSVGSARIAGLALSNMSMKLRAEQGVVHLFPIKASLYGGGYSGDITYDAHGAMPSVVLNQQLTNVDVTPLLQDSVQSHLLSGHGNASTKLVGAGRTSDELIRSLSGRVEANLANGAVNGIDLWYEISLAQALLKQQPLPQGSDDGRTKFDTFRMSADLSGGVATTRDLSIASQYLRVSGAGNLNLTTHAIDYHVVATILKAPPSALNQNLQQLTLADIPVAISGTTSDPKVRPDLQAALKGQLRQKLQDTLNDKLQGIFGTRR